MVSANWVVLSTVSQNADPTYGEDLEVAGKSCKRRCSFDFLRGVWAMLKVIFVKMLVQFYTCTLPACGS